MADLTDEPINQLLQRHVDAQLRAYKGNLAFAVRVVDYEWLPAEGDPGIQHHLETLRQHLAELGHPEDDSFLLRLGLTVPGTQRGIQPPIMVLEEDRGGFSARRQGEAEGQILRLREALEIGRQFVHGISPDTQQAVAELADRVQGWSAPSDVEWLGWFGGLSFEQSKQVAERAIECLDSEKDSLKEMGTQVLQNLACFREAPLSEMCCSELIARGIFWPSSLYRDSGDAVAGQLVSLIESETGQDSLNHLLLALGWTRSAPALNAFRRWNNKAPSWASELHVPPEEYLHNAGWCLDEDGQRRDLVSANCFRLVPVEEATASSVRCRTRINEQCSSCGGSLYWLFDFSEISAEYMVGIPAEAPRKVLCCLHCSCFGPFFTNYGQCGAEQLRVENDGCGFQYNGDRESCIRRLVDSPCSPFACAEPFAIDDASTLGGIPMWLQDAEFPRCTECGRLMTFLAQHDNSPLGEEGIYYAFFCDRCHVAAVSYQQT